MSEQDEKMRAEFEAWRTTKYLLSFTDQEIERMFYAWAASRAQSDLAHQADREELASAKLLLEAQKSEINKQNMRAIAESANAETAKYKRLLESAEQRIRESQEQEPALVISSNSKLGVSIEDARGNDLPWNTIVAGDKFYKQPIIPPSPEELQRDLTEQKELWKDLRNVLEGTQRENIELRADLTAMTECAKSHDEARTKYFLENVDLTRKLAEQQAALFAVRAILAGCESGDAIKAVAHIQKHFADNHKELTKLLSELETANKGLQIALLDANEKEKELQLRNAMLVDFVHEVANEMYPYPDQAVRKADQVLKEFDAQSAAWLENSHREWMKGLPVVRYLYRYPVPAGTELYTDLQGSEEPMETIPLYAIPKGD